MTPEELVWLIVFLAIILILVIIVVVLARQQSSRPLGASNYQVYPGTDGTTLNICSDTRNQPCIYPAATLSDAVNQCNLLQCEMFAYNSSTLSMKIIDPATTFANRATDTYQAIVKDSNSG